MGKILLWAEYKINAGPSNVHRSWIENSNDELLYIKSNNKYLKYIELIWKILFCNVIIYPAYTAIRDVKFFKMLGKKGICIVHGCMSYENKIIRAGKNQEKIEIHENRIFELSDIILCVSQKSSQWFKNRFPKFEDKITFVNNGIIIQPRPKKNKIINTIAISGGNRKIKNNNLVCQAVQKLNNEGIPCSIKIFGRLYPDCEDLSNYPHTEYLSHLDKETYYNILDEISLYVIASEVETFGLSIADALNCNCSLLMSDNVGGASIMNTKDEDIIMDPHNIDELAAKIRYILENPNHARLLSTINVNECSEKQAWNNLKSICLTISKNEKEHC